MLTVFLPEQEEKRPQGNKQEDCSEAGSGGRSAPRVGRDSGRRAGR
jgi:hypothetical protein